MKEPMHLQENFCEQVSSASDGEIYSNDEEYPVGVVPLEVFCHENPRVALAFSGGCDSTYLLSVLIDAGVEVKAYYVKTAFQADFELRDALSAIRDIGASLEVIEADVLSQAEVCANPPDRCYLCKRFIFGVIQERMVSDGFEVLVDGTNASDDPTRRPGFRALTELGVRSPLRLAGLSKDDIRLASQKRALFTWEKPNFSCLATKIDEGSPLTAEALASVAVQAESTEWATRFLSENKISEDDHGTTRA